MPGIGLISRVAAELAQACPRGLRTVWIVVLRVQRAGLRRNLHYSILELLPSIRR
jgi:hypothetical protein